jgi:hypothetical protein
MTELIDYVTICSTKKAEGEKKITNNELLIAKNKNLQIGIKMSEGKKILRFDKDDPKLYADFPLIGSHNYPIVYTMNSHIFWPDEERSSIILN